MNVFVDNNIQYKFESFWRSSKSSKEVDNNKMQLPWPKPNIVWGERQLFIDKLLEVEQHLEKQNAYHKYKPDDIKQCHLCDKIMTRGYYEINNDRWEDGLKHYISAHNTKPTQEFIDIIFRFTPEYVKNISRTIVNLNGKKFIRRDKTFVKLDINQINILDALMKHGSYSKRYVDKNNKTIYRYSEHVGLLDFNNNKLEKIIISGNTTRVDLTDDEIFQPKNLEGSEDFEYTFHTHPATPYPGSRAKDGILYEFPSIGDMFHFYDHYNRGITQGSIIITPEGMYNIRKNLINDEKIFINENNFYKHFNKTIRTLEVEAIDKYGTKIKSDIFYSDIAQNMHYIDELNNMLKIYDLHIDFFSRIKDKKRRWVIDSVHLPVYSTEPV